MCLPLASQFIKWINRFRYPKRYGIRFVGEDGNHRWSWVSCSPHASL